MTDELLNALLVGGEHSESALKSTCPTNRKDRKCTLQTVGTWSEAKRMLSVPGHQISVVVLEESLLSDQQIQAAAEWMAAYNLKVPIIVLAKEPGHERMRYLLSLGVQDYLPLSEVTFSSILRSALHSVERQRLRWENKTKSRELHDTLRGVSDAVLLLDRDQTVVRANPAAYNLLGLKSGELIGRKCYQVVHGLDHPPEFCKHKDMLGQGDTEFLPITRNEFFEPRLDRYLSANWIPAVDADNTFVGSIHVIHDQTAAKLREQALIESESRLRFLCSCSQEYLIIHHHGNIRFCNDNVKRLVADKLAKLDETEVSIPQLMAVVKPEYHEAMLSAMKSDQDMAYRFQSVDGRWFEANAKPIIFEKEFCRSVLIRDVTDLWEAQEDVSQQSQLTKSLTDNMTDFLWAKDLDGNYLFANQAMRDNFLHTSSTDLVGHDDQYFADRLREQGFDNEFVYEWVKSDQETIRAGRPLKFLEQGVVRDREMTIEVYKSPLRDGDGSIVGIVGCGRDMTDTWRSVERANRVLEALTETMLEFKDVSLNYEDEVDPLLAKFGSLLDLDRAYVYQKVTAPDLPSGCYYSLDREWVTVNRNIKPQMDSGLVDSLGCDLESSLNPVPRWYEAFENDEMVYGCPDDFSESERSVLESKEVKSVAMVPVTILESDHPKCWGFLGFDDCTFGHDWTEQEIHALCFVGSLLGRIIGRSIERKHQHHELVQLRKKLDVNNARIAASQARIDEQLADIKQRYANTSGQN